MGPESEKVTWMEIFFGKEDFSRNIKESRAPKLGPLDQVCKRNLELIAVLSNKAVVLYYKLLLISALSILISYKGVLITLDWSSIWKMIKVS